MGLATNEEGREDLITIFLLAPTLAKQAYHCCAIKTPVEQCAWQGNNFGKLALEKMREGEEEAERRKAWINYMNLLNCSISISKKILCNPNFYMTPKCLTSTLNPTEANTSSKNAEKSLAQDKKSSCGLGDNNLDLNFRSFNWVCRSFDRVCVFFRRGEGGYSVQLQENSAETCKNKLFWYYVWVGRLEKRRETKNCWVFTLRANRKRGWEEKKGERGERQLYSARLLWCEMMGWRRISSCLRCTIQDGSWDSITTWLQRILCFRTSADWAADIQVSTFVMLEIYQAPKLTNQWNCSQCFGGFSQLSTPRSTSSSAGTWTAFHQRGRPQRWRSGCDLAK